MWFICDFLELPEELSAHWAFCLRRKEEGHVGKILFQDGSLSVSLAFWLFTEFRWSIPFSAIDYQKELQRAILPLREIVWMEQEILTQLIQIRKPYLAGIQISKNAHLRRLLGNSCFSLPAVYPISFRGPVTLMSQTGRSFPLTHQLAGENNWRGVAYCCFPLCVVPPCRQNILASIKAEDFKTALQFIRRGDWRYCANKENFIENILFPHFPLAGIQFLLQNLPPFERFDVPVPPAYVFSEMEVKILASGFPPGILQRSVTGEGLCWLAENTKSYSQTDEFLVALRYEIRRQMLKEQSFRERYYEKAYNRLNTDQKFIDKTHCTIGLCGRKSINPVSEGVKLVGRVGPWLDGPTEPVLVLEFFTLGSKNERRKEITQ